MAIDKVVKTDSSTYSVVKGGTAYTVKVNEGDKLTKQYAGNLPFTESEWASIEASQSTPSQTSNSVSVFSNPYQSSGNIWQYSPCYFGNTISYPETPMSAMNDRAVWQFADSVTNMPAMLGGTMNSLNALLQKMQSEQAEMMKKLFEKISSGTQTDKKDNDSKTEDKSDSTAKSEVSASDLEKLKIDNERLKKELEEANRVKSYRDTLKDNSAFDRKVNDIVERLYKGMKGANWSSIAGEVGNDKKTSDAVNEISAKNIVEVMEKYKNEKCISGDGGYMGNDFNLIESIYEDFSGEKYTKKIDHLRDTLSQRARNLIAQYGDKSGITEDDIAEFESEVKNNMNDSFLHKWGWGGDCEKLKWAFENFKEKIKSAEGSADRTVYTTTTSVTPLTTKSGSEVVTSQVTTVEKETEKKTVTK